MTDNDGNVTSRTCGSQTVTFTWTAENRLGSLTALSQTTTFDYNAGGRLIRMSKPGLVRHFVWERDNLLAELDSAGTSTIAEYSYYPGLDNPQALVVGNTAYFAHRDLKGNVIALTGTNLSLARTYEYGAFGTSEGGTDYANFAGKDRARFKSALSFGDGLADLYYMRNRWYEPGTGRFLSEDPIGLEGGLNQYVFAADDPINQMDPLGEDLRPVQLPNGSTVWMDCFDFGEATRCYPVDVAGVTIEGRGSSSGLPGGPGPSVGGFGAAGGAGLGALGGAGVAGVAGTLGTAVRGLAGHGFPTKLNRAGLPQPYNPANGHWLPYSANPGFRESDLCGFGEGFCQGYFYSVGAIADLPTTGNWGQFFGQIGGVLAGNFHNIFR